MSIQNHSKSTSFSKGESNPYTLSASAIFGALAAIMAILPLSFPFPLIPYLKFDLAELPVIIAFLLYGPIPGLTSSIVYWLILNIVGSFAPIGPLMKFAAVISTIIGMWIGIKMYNKFTSTMKMITFLTLILSMSIVVRVLITTLANYIVIWILFPTFLEYAAKSLSGFLKVTFSTNFDKLILTLIITAIYNVIHVLLSIIPSYGIVAHILNRGIIVTIKEPWVIKTLKHLS
ncbi:MAG: hypothetical protein QW372_07270 [Nitrososphaerales archaeon]